MNRIASIERQVASAFGITVDDLHVKRRFWRIAFPRQVVVYLFTSTVRRGGSAAARHYGQSVTTTWHSKRAVQDAIDTDPKVRALVEGLRKAISLNCQQTQTKAEL